MDIFPFDFTTYYFIVVRSKLNRINSQPNKYVYTRTSIICIEVADRKHQLNMTNWRGSEENFILNEYFVCEPKSFILSRFDCTVYNSMTSKNQTSWAKLMVNDSNDLQPHYIKSNQKRKKNKIQWKRWNRGKLCKHIGPFE